MAKITKRLVDALAPAERDKLVWDETLKGFGVKCTPAGRKVYVAQYRLAGTIKRYTIGRHGSPWTPDTARKEAEWALGSASIGQDPATLKRDARGEPTFSEICDRYLTEHVAIHNKATTRRESQRIVNQYIRPRFGRDKISTINKDKLRAWHVSMQDRPYMANRALACIAKILSLCANDWDLRPDNPALGVRKFGEEKRNRYLSPNEFLVFGVGLRTAEAEGINPMAIAAIRLMVMTGCRRQEVLSLKKEYIDFEGSKLRLPDSKTGAKEVPLGTGALELLELLCGLSSSHYVLPSHQDDKHFVGVPKIWAAIRKAIGMEEVRLHDLRHTFASVAVTSGESLLMIKAILGHKDQATTQRYAHLQDDPVKAVADRTSATIAAAMLGNPNSKAPN